MALKSCGFALGLTLAALIAGMPAASAQTKPAAPAARPAAPASNAAPVAAPTAAATPAQPVAPDAPAATLEVTGFRSARFGASETDVRAAIVKDFGVKPDAIRTDSNKAEQTTILVARVPEVLQGGGTADVSYVFGYKSKQLIRVGVTWSKETDDKMTADQLLSNATVLRTHFSNAGYKPDSIAANTPVPNGLIMFRGSDSKDHATLLLLQGTYAQGKDDQRVLTPTDLVLLYVADAKTPDVFKLPPGSF